jgi:hypothetical protein
MILERWLNLLGAALAVMLVRGLVVSLAALDAVVAEIAAKVVLPADGNHWYKMVRVGDYGDIFETISGQYSYPKDL